MNIASYVIKRILLAIPTILGVTILVFFMIHLVPGDPAVTLLGPRATPELIAKLHHAWGLDKPLLQQYLLYMGRLLHGDLGDSFFFQLPSRTLIAERTGATATLLVTATLFTVIFTIPLAILAAVKRDKPTDHLVRSVPIRHLGHAVVLGRHHAHPAGVAASLGCSPSAATARTCPSISSR